MKKIKLIILLPLYLFSSQMQSQETIKPIESALLDKEYENPNTYYKDTNGKLQNCVGTWEYDNGVDYLKIIFTITKDLLNEYYNVYYDCLHAKYLYRKNGVVIYDNLNILNPSPNANTRKSGLESAFVKNSKISFVYSEPSFTDCHRRKTGRMELQLILSGSGELQLQWNRTTSTRYFETYACENGAPIDDSEFLIPANMLLTKLH